MTPAMNMGCCSLLWCQEIQREGKKVMLFLDPAGGWLIVCSVHYGATGFETPLDREDNNPVYNVQEILRQS